MTAIAAFQFANVPLPSDLAVYNFSSSDIASNLAVMIDATNVVGTAGDAPGIAVVSGTPYAVGVTMEIIKAAGTSGVPTATSGRIRTQGLVWMTANGTITAGGVVDASTTSLKVGWAVAHVTAHPQLGVAWSTAADGEPVLVLLQPSNNA